MQNRSRAAATLPRARDARLEKRRRPVVPSDADLLVLVLRGDEAALGVLYDRHISMLWRVALQTSGTSELAEAAVGAVVSRLWREPVAAPPPCFAAFLVADVAREGRARRRAARSPRR